MDYTSNQNDTKKPVHPWDEPQAQPQATAYPWDDPQQNTTGYQAPTTADINHSTMNSELGQNNMTNGYAPVPVAPPPPQIAMQQNP